MRWTHWLVLDLALVMRVTGGDAWIEVLRGSGLDLDLEVGGGGEMG